jgi:hypothetical protein
METDAGSLQTDGDAISRDPHTAASGAIASDLSSRRRDLSI